MGILRTLLALAVVFDHIPGAQSLSVLMPGIHAVQLFYIISGFLISYILRTNRAYDNTPSFYINRFLRLYPIYWAVALLSLAGHLVKDKEFIGLYRGMPPSACAVLILTNVFLFGQDWVMFLRVHAGHLSFTTTYYNSDIRLYQALVVPQAWTLGVELSFYLIAPFVVRRRWLLLTLLGMSLILRIGLVANGIGLKDPWTYRFFPTELALFLLGALSQQILLPFYQTYLKDSLRTVSITGTSFLVVCTVLFNSLSVNETLKTFVLLGSYLALLPLTFIFQNMVKIDKKIGDLSYPIYIGHLFMIEIVTFILMKVHMYNSFSIIPVAVTASLLFAVWLNQTINSRVERIRAIIRSRRAPVASP